MFHQVIRTHTLSHCMRELHGILSIYQHFVFTFGLTPGPSRCSLLYMKPGPNQLREWIDRKGLADGEAAKVIGVDFTYISKLVNGHRQPSLDNAVKIERVTGVPVGAWVSSYLGRVVKPRPKNTKSRAA